MDADVGTGRLYGLPPEEFVTARDELARALRGAGDRQAAATVARLRRPTVAAWAVNQAARQRPELVSALLEAGERLREAQRRALSGLRDSGLREAGAERRGAVERLLAVAVGVLEEAGRPPDAHRDAVAATLQAASVDETAGAALRAGTLGRELAAPSGFGEVAGLELAAPPAPPPEPGTAPGTAPARRRPKLDAARRRELQAARRRRDGLQRRARAAASAATAARQAADQAEQDAGRAGETAERLAGEARQARRAAEEARRAAERARQEAEAAREQARRAALRARATVERALAAEATARTAREALALAGREVTGLEPGD